MLIITITVYPNLKVVQKLKDQDGHSLTAFDKPDIVNQVFQLKVAVMIKYLERYNIFRHYMAHRYKLE